MKHTILVLALATVAVAGCTKEQPPQAAPTPTNPTTPPAATSPTAATVATAIANDPSKAAGEAPKAATDSSKDAKK